MHGREELGLTDVAEVDLMDELEKGMVADGESGEGLRRVFAAAGNGYAEGGKSIEGSLEVDVEEYAAEVEEYVFEGLHGVVVVV